ncbi:50S ribosomal protein L29 [Desulfuromonas acetoxidans]|uniref:Large ribosomal subunit protein uL29 n=1 Tax=Desulfuromonas acetoxidans (strain DSM 684 / 11070) TaxID=281689 RepID=Q1JVD8_DESA6|nr:50S ribosomal protein L29 [Desulfuromonas acetoxidans]EAT14196.1 ribosomal protein L29 [Desulfuromonas acetoxidans DSM 684]MBF0644045.1 50S ribosomal protein L29 [Desulfuromonas acetoxidans]NVD23283.1 50S ribosomal protein L29 [Desulfuromonas acetoxidans]NVE15476.1 50S ribosomal protein L29 [Desulfuromonas acetoxidans]
MKAKELQGFSVEELEKKSLELSQELFNLKFQLHTGHLDDTAKIPQVRKDIARVKTVLRQKLA